MNVAQELLRSDCMKRVASNDASLPKASDMFSLQSLTVEFDGPRALMSNVEDGTGAALARRELIDRFSCSDLDDIPTGWYAPSMNSQAMERLPGGARRKLLDAAFSIIRQKGYAATTVDDLCAKAGVTKGAFFHHFPTKDSLAVAALNQWTVMSNTLFAAASYHRLEDPLDRILGYLDFRKQMLRGAVAEFSCLAGTIVQETYETHPKIRDACGESIGSQAESLESDIAAAMKRYRIRERWTAKSLALHTQAVLQGAFIVAKAKGDAAVAEASVDHLHRYISLLFSRPGRKARREH